jgi:hypothetical protein
MSFYLIGQLVTLVPLGSISSWTFKPYCDDVLLGISPTVRTNVWRAQLESYQKAKQGTIKHHLDEYDLSVH